MFFYTRNVMKQRGAVVVGMVTGMPNRQDMQEAILYQAGQCLFQAKESGRNRIIIQEVDGDHSISSVVW